MRRVITLPAEGALLVSTDLHGNLEDFTRLQALFEGLLAKGEAHWAILGDTVHGPSFEARTKNPALYGYDDASYAIVAALAALKERHPDRVHYVLGNHDYGHLGGPRTSKFYPDEVGRLEATLTPAERAALKRFFAGALLAVVAPCGALLAHGSPDDALSELADLDRVVLPPPREDDYARRLLRGFLMSYGQPAEVTARLLAAVSKAGVEARFVIHGHDRDEAGFFFEGENQLCPVLFGAPREAKRYVLLDLAARYPGASALLDGREIRRLYE
jgi:hypothetical protein